MRTYDLLRKSVRQGKPLHPVKGTKRINVRVAIYHASTKPISRSAGRSAVAAAAYRSGSELVDQRTGLVHDYTRKGGVVSSDILTPDGGTADRLALWNAAEQAEKRKDARTAREWIVALPSELDAGQRRELALSFGAELSRRYGVGVDVCIHQPDREGDNRNHHAHLLTTTRKVSSDAAKNLVLGEKASIELSDKKRREIGLGPAADEVTSVRRLWEEQANQALEKAGRGERIDARSLTAQGIDREATTHLGPVASEMERRGVQSDRGDGNRQTAANNAQRQALKAEIINLRAERERRADPLKPYRTAVEAEKPGTLEWAQASGRLSYAGALLTAGENPQHHFSAIAKAGDDAAIKWLKQSAAAASTPAKPEIRDSKDVDSAAELVRQWDIRQKDLVRDYRRRSQSLEERLWRQIEEIEGKRSRAMQEHGQKRPQEPQGLFGAFKRGKYEKALTAWKEAAKRIQEWGRSREESLRERLKRVRQYFTGSDWKLHEAAEAKLKRERPEWAERMPRAVATLKAEAEEQKARKKAMQKQKMQKMPRPRQKPQGWER